MPESDSDPAVPDPPPVLEFYTALGFEVTYQQRSPNPYAVVEHGGIELQFFAMKHYEPTGSISTCYVLIDDVDGLYQALSRAQGGVPAGSHPGPAARGRFKDMSYGVRQFLMTDPGGNCVRVGQRTGGERHHGPGGDVRAGPAPRPSWRTPRGTRRAPPRSSTG
ncbi:hypothetical protein SVIOM74S_09790 [Streptomyces violarus]